MVALLAQALAVQHLVVKKFYLVALLLNHALRLLAAAAAIAATAVLTAAAQAVLLTADADADAVAAVKNVAGGRFSKTKTAVTNATNAAVTAATN